MGAGNFKSFRDMIDGGGAGATGKTFEGAGLYSDIANMIATPLGSQQAQQMGQTRPQARPSTMSTQGNAAPTPMAQPQPQRPQARPAGLLDHGMPQMPQGPMPTPQRHFSPLRTGAPGYPQETAAPGMPRTGVYAPSMQSRPEGGPQMSTAPGMPRTELERLNDSDLIRMGRQYGIIK